MNQETTLASPHKLWVRALLMILLAGAFQLAASILLFVAVLQLVLAAATDKPNGRLQHFGRCLGRYMAQIADFESFGSEELPFPFSAWPSGNNQITS